MTQVISNRRMMLAGATALLMAACGGVDDTVVSAATEEGGVTAAEQRPAVTQASKEAALQRTSEVQSPVEINYRVIGTPIVGQPVALDLQFKSAFGSTPYQVSYRVNDDSALRMPEAQSASVSIAPTGADERVAQQVTVVPLREGRLYLNVAAVIETDAGSMRTVTAVPIQVGPAAPRQIIENGTVTTDADGNLIRSLPADENQ